MLNGKVALITGANGGLGNSVTHAFLNAGATVYGVSRAIQDSEFAHPSFHAISADVKSSTQASALATRIVSEAGRIDSLIHLVGAFAGGKSLEETGEDIFERMLDLNYRTAYRLFQAVLPVMRNQHSGAIVAIGSRTAVHAAPMLGAYSASKAAMVSLVQTIALETRNHGITANVVLPGTMDTPANRVANPSADPSRWVQPAQVAALLLHLASPQASQLSGAVLPIYGGDL
jgi:NAD(P)-dependent dehydrogenase (short-subunit alcohol dehydrogenase family)